MALYAKVQTPQDIARINCMLRDEMLIAKDEATLTELKKRSDYLCTLTYSPFWQKRFGKMIEDLRQVAIEENRISVRTANIVATYRGFAKEYHPWRKDIDIEEQLRHIPQKILEELENAKTTLAYETEILEVLRQEFCAIRKGMVLCEKQNCLEEFKRQVDVLATLPFTSDFARAFEEGMLAAIDALIETEKNRSIVLANMVAYVQGWDIYFEAVSEEEIEAIGADTLLQLLDEEKRSLSYIPTQARYKGGGTVVWVVYYHPKRKREYAKRVYLPANYRNLKMEGPGKFKNRFGNSVWGVKISYEEEIAPTTIHVRGREIKLPARWIERTKVVPIPKIAQNVRLLEERPASAMDIA